MSIDAFRQQLEAIGADYRRQLPEKLARIDGLWGELASGGGAPAKLAELLRELHSMAGSAKTLGVAGVSEAAAAAEAFLAPFSKRQKMPDAARQAEFLRLLDVLKRAAGRSAP